MLSGLPRVSVIIPCHTSERLEDTRAAIASVLNQGLAPDEVIVAVDHNASLLEALRRLVPARVQFVANEGLRGASPTRNAGIRAATGDIIVNLDDDAVAHPDWLERLISAFQNPRVMGASGRVVPIWPSDKRPAWFPEEFEFMIGCTGHYTLIKQTNGEVRNVTGTNMAFRSEAFARAGLWKADFGRGNNKTGGEEAEFCLRIKKTIPDALIVFEPSARVYHRIHPQRARVRYMLTYAFNEGIVRSQLRRHLLHVSDRPLAGEYLFLRRILGRAIPARLRRLQDPASVAQLCIIVANVCLIGSGYVRDRYANG
jgi:cellulose synthase/poly-beta-1,6-N-acetylglucosamine synthase-like glycosyltransferase